MIPTTIRHHAMQIRYCALPAHCHHAWMAPTCANSAGCELAWKLEPNAMAEPILSVPTLAEPIAAAQAWIQPEQKVQTAAVSEPSPVAPTLAA
jgi:hypothetical protein